MTIRILITSAGSLVGDAILRCLAGVRGRLTIVGVNSVAAAVAFGCDRLHRVPPTADGPAYAAALHRILARERPALVLPGRDADVPALAALAASGAFPGTAFPVPPPSLAPVFFDKSRTHRFARDHGLPFAPTAEDPADAAALARRHGYPLLAKPRSGAGSRDVFLLHDAAELARAAGDPRMMVQAFLGKAILDAPVAAFRRLSALGMPWRWAFEDEEATAELTVAPDGAVSTLCLDCGTTAPPLRTAVRLLADPAVAAAGLAWARALAAHGHRGVVNVQGKRLPDGRFVPYEVGARFGGTSVARAMLGRNQVLHLVAEHLGWPAPVFADRPGRVGLESRRTMVPAAWRRRFEEDGEWQAPAGGGIRHAAFHAGPPAADAPPPHWIFGGPAHDRLAVAAYARRRGLPFAPLAVTVEEAEAMVPGGDAVPLFVAKPRRGDGPVLLLEGRAAVAAALAAGGTVVQPFLAGDDDAADSLAAQRAAWRTRPGTPWGWAVADVVEVAEADLTEADLVAAGADGRLPPVRTALCTQRGGEIVAVRPTHDAGVAAAFRRWAAALGGDGHRGPLRISGKRAADGRWLPFAVSPRPFGLPGPLPAGDGGDGDEEARMLVPALLPAA